ncbi:MAG: bifunctional oligoribonuclease/PAP phosphatase NrnA [Planctomycetota bacterium]|nr:bifunctional oligoribonuclease/PAP phosphatase NrnA [Planctomycetota bacterium]
MSIDWEPLWELVDSNQRFVLSSHVNPDADALGSELGMAGILEGLGKSVVIANPSSGPANLAFLDPENRCHKLGQGVTQKEVLDTDVHIVLDTSAWQQLQAVGKILKKSTAKKAVIDHHVSSDDLGGIELKDTECDATGSLVYQFAASRNRPITESMATALYTAIATDTGWFRFPATGAQTMRTAAALIDAGAQPALVYQQLYERRSLARTRLWGVVLGRVELAFDGRLGYTHVELKDFDQTGAAPADTEELVNECLKIEGTEAAFIAVEQRNSLIKFSFRSRTSMDVAAVAEQFGGGGHKQAAGAKVKGPLSDALTKVMAVMTSEFTDESPPNNPSQ